MHVTELYTPPSFTVNNVPTATVDGPQPKLIDLINDRTSTKRHFFSIEISPKNNINLDYTSFASLPLFTAITWLGHENLPQESASVHQAPAIRMGAAVRQSTAILQHVTCHNLSERHVDELLSMNVKNILALTGDNCSRLSFKNAKDLVGFLRRKGGLELTIAVAGYPDVHSLAENGDVDLQHLKEKVDAGADFVITQILFSSQTFRDFVSKCRAKGILVPIVPGICLPKTFNQLQTILKLTGLKPTLQYTDIGDDDSEFQRKMLETTVALVQELFASTDVVGVHFFTLNNMDLLRDVLCRLHQLGIQF